MAFRTSLILLHFIITLSCQAQYQNKINNNDSIALFTLVKNFAIALEEHRNDRLIKMSLLMIDCIPCGGNKHIHDLNYSIPVDTLINFIHEPFNRKWLKSITTKNPSVNIITVPGKHFSVKPLRGQAFVTIYELFYMYIQPDELEMGHEGSQIGLQFVKVEEDFKLFGLVTVP